MNNHIGRSNLVCTSIQENFLLFEVTLSFTSNQHKIQKVNNTEAVVNIRITGSQTRDRIQVETNWHNLTYNRSTIHNLELLEGLSLDGIVGAARSDEFFTNQGNLTILQVEIHDLEGNLTEDTLLQVEDLLVVFELDVEEVVDTDFHGDGVGTEFLFTEPSLTVVGIGF